jgi:hypothetical protein
LGGGWWLCLYCKKIFLFPKKEFILKTNGKTLIELIVTGNSKIAFELRGQNQNGHIGKYKVASGKDET